VTGTFGPALDSIDHQRFAKLSLRWSGDRRLAPRLAQTLPTRPEYAPFFHRALAIPQARTSACSAIVTLDLRKAVPDLIALLRSPDPQVVAALVSLTGQDFGTNRPAWMRWWDRTGKHI
jgi:HEAT repeat protein